VRGIAAHPEFVEGVGNSIAGDKSPSHQELTESRFNGLVFVVSGLRTDETIRKSAARQVTSNARPPRICARGWADRRPSGSGTQCVCPEDYFKNCDTDVKFFQESRHRFSLIVTSSPGSPSPSTDTIPLTVTSYITAAARAFSTTIPTDRVWL
jgi:hypothetical protein